MNEALVLFRRKCPPKFDGEKFANKLAGDAIRKAIELCGKSKVKNISRFLITYGPEQIEIKADEAGVQLKPGAKPTYYWARVETVVLSEVDVPKRLTRGTNGKLRPIWI